MRWAVIAGMVALTACGEPSRDATEDATTSISSTASSGDSVGSSSGDGSPSSASSADAGDASDTTGTTDTGESSDTEDPSAPSLYGVPWASDSLTNIEIGYSHQDAGAPYRTVSIRFRAAHSGVFDSWKQFFVFADYVQRRYCQQPPFDADSPNGCYGANTGGIIRLELRADDGSAEHLPSAASLATATLTDPMNSARGYPIYGAGGPVHDGHLTGSFRVIPASSWSAQPRLSAGQLYHMVFTNDYAGADPWWDSHYISIDSIQPPTPTDRQPGASDTDLAVLYQDPGDSWTEQQATPSFQVSYQDGFTQGLGYIDAPVGTPKPVAADNQARELFTVSGGDRLVSTIFVRLARTSTMPAGPLTLRVETESRGALDECTIDAAAVDTVHDWVSCSLTSVPNLEDGTTHALVLSAPSGVGTYLIYALQKGTGYGFDPNVAFGDGHADYSVDGGATWPESIADWGSAVAFDYQFYFAVE